MRKTCLQTCLETCVQTLFQGNYIREHYHRPADGQLPLRAAAQGYALLCHRISTKHLSVDRVGSARFGTAGPKAHVVKEATS